MSYVNAVLKRMTLSAALILGAVSVALSNPGFPVPAGRQADLLLSAGAAPLVDAAHKSRRHGTQRPRRNESSKDIFNRHHRRFHERYSQRQKTYPRAHRKFHKHYGQRHRWTGPTIRIYPGYDPFYYNPYYYDPYYDAPDVRLSCARVRTILLHHGYRNVRAFDCKGDVYGFYAIYGGRRYKIRANAYTGQVVSRHRV